MSDKRNPVVAFLGWLLMGAGGLIVLTAGDCSAFFLISMLGYPEGIPGMLGMILVFGGIPVVVGLSLFFAGRYLARLGQSRQRPPHRVPSEDDGSGL